MSVDTTVTIAGNIVHDLELSFINDGKQKVTFAVAVNREINGEKYVSYFDCTAWGNQAEHAVASFKKGERVIVTGQLRQNTFERKDGTKGSSVEIIASEIAASVLWGTTTFTKA